MRSSRSRLPVALAAAAALLQLLAATALAHGERAAPASLAEALLAWSFEPVVVVGLLAAAVLYARGWVWLHRPGRGAGFPRWRLWSFGVGLATTALALLSPIATFNDELFALHMVQHLLLVLVAAPLLLLGLPVVPLLQGLPRPARRAVGGCLAPGHPVERALHALTHPLVAASVFLVTLTAWHIPALYDLAQGDSLVHELEHTLFIGTALLYWWPIVHPMGGPRRLGYGLAILYLVPAILQGNVLGAGITLADRPLYTTYVLAPRISGLSALADQQLGGLIMWVPGGLFWAIPLFTLLALFLRHEEAMAEASERRGLAGPQLPARQ